MVRRSNSDDLWFGSGTNTNYVVIYDLYCNVQLMGYVIINICPTDDVCNYV